MSVKISWFLVGVLVLSPAVAFADQQGPNLQQRRAMQEAQAMAMKKQQEVAIFKKQRDELIIGYKTLQKAKNDAYGQMKISERDYKTALAKFNQAKEQEEQIQVQVNELRKNVQKIDAAALERQTNKLRQDQSQLVDKMKSFSKIQQESYEAMLNYDNEYRGFLAKEQVLRQQIENVQRQLQFVVSQP